ncbi:MAG: YcaO-like family protein, partial [Alphaproteobacteria bacterium]
MNSYPEPKMEGATFTSKAYRWGTHRSVSPAETFNRVWPLAPAMGITRVANVTGLDQIGIPVVMVTRPNSRSLSVAQGKGATLEAAKASGVMEAIESHHAETIHKPLMLASIDEMLSRRDLIDVAGLPLAGRARLGRSDPILWIEGEDIAANKSLWIPFECVSLNLSGPALPHAGVFQSGSNGLASGNVLSEATLHGMLEVVERDATTLWQIQNSAAQNLTRIDLDSIDDPLCRSLLGQFDEAGIAVGVWDITSDVGVPVFLCRIIESSDNPSQLIRPAAGMGCHLDRSVALMRAMTEAAQSRLTFIAGSRDDLNPEDFVEFRRGDGRHAWRSLIHDGVAERRFQDVQTASHATFEEDILHVLECLAGVDIQSVCAVNLTKD